MRKAIIYRISLSVLTTFSTALAYSQSPPGAPVPTPPPNAEHQTPAFPSQTRALQMSSEFDFETSVLTSDLEHPWAIEILSDGDLLISERPGRLRIVSPDGNVEKPIRGVPEVDNRDQGGLLDIALAPDFEQSRTVFLSFAQPRGNNKTATAVAKATLSKNRQTLSDLKVIFQQEPPWRSTKHYGSRLVFSDDDTLFVTLGERSLPEPRQLAQNLGTHLGKVVHIQTDGTPAPGNPWVDKDKGLAENWSYGHRNIQGAALHPETNALWVIEHGPQGGDEVNVAEAGKNYGWPVITYGEDYSGEPIGKGITEKGGMEQPLYYWDPVIAPAGALFYTGEMFGEWQGDLLISSLRPGGIVRLELNGRKVTGEERLFGDLGRVRDVEQAEDGSLWIVTDEQKGKLVHIARQKDPRADERGSDKQNER